MSKHLYEERIEYSILFAKVSDNFKIHLFIEKSQPSDTNSVTS